MEGHKIGTHRDSGEKIITTFPLQPAFSTEPCPAPCQRCARPWRGCVCIPVPGDTATPHWTRVQVSPTGTLRLPSLQPAAQLGSSSQVAPLQRSGCPQRGTARQANTAGPFTALLCSPSLESSPCSHPPQFSSCSNSLPPAPGLGALRESLHKHRLSPCGVTCPSLAPVCQPPGATWRQRWDAAWETKRYFLPQHLTNSLCCWKRAAQHPPGAGDPCISRRNTRIPLPTPSLPPLQNVPGWELRDAPG